MKYTENLDDYAFGYLMTTSEFYSDVEIGMLTDYDGYGYAVKDKKVCNSVSIFPSKYNLVPKDATHILWFNR